MRCIAAVSPKSLDAMMLQGHTDPTRNAAAFDAAGFAASVLHAPGLTIETRAMLLERVRRLHSDLTAAQASHTHAPHASQYARACELGNARTPRGMLPVACHVACYVPDRALGVQGDASRLCAVAACCLPCGQLRRVRRVIYSSSNSNDKTNSSSSSSSNNNKATTTTRVRARARAHAHAHTHTHTHTRTSESTTRTRGTESCAHTHSHAHAHSRMRNHTSHTRPRAGGSFLGFQISGYGLRAHGFRGSGLMGYGK